VAPIDTNAVLKDAVKGASTVPAYALVIVCLVIVFAVSTQVPFAAMIVVDVTVLILCGYVIWVIELRSRRSVATPLPGQTQRIAEMRDLDIPIQGVLEDLVGDDDVYVVYSSTEQREFVDQLGNTVRPEGDPAYGGAPEKRATTIPDAVGASRLQNLLYLGGKRSRLKSITSWKDDFKSEYWDSSLILIGSGKSNAITPQVLKEFESPYDFTPNFNAIIDRTEPEVFWPADGGHLVDVDYGIVVKLKVTHGDRTTVYLVVAGVGPYGTLAGCKFVEREIQRIYTDFGSEPFAYLLSVTRDATRSFTPVVERQRALPVIRR
jgi:hypothetical protein